MIMIHRYFANLVATLEIKYVFGPREKLIKNINYENTESNEEGHVQIMSPEVYGLREGCVMYKV